MQLARHHSFALAGALGLTAVAVFDAVTHGLTGHWSVFSDDGDVAWLKAVGSIVHGLAYAGAVWVLHAERRRIHANRAAAVFGWLAYLAFWPLAVGFLTVYPFHAFGIVDADVVSPVIAVAFVLQFVAAIGLGLSLWRHPATGPGSRILRAVVPVIAATALVAVLAPDWAHPAYVEACVLIGIALLGAASPASPAARPTNLGEESLAGR